jgi:hypothetical protein
MHSLHLFSALAPATPAQRGEREDRAHHPSSSPRRARRTCSTPAPADFGNRQLEILAIEVKGDISLDPSALFSGETARIRVIFHADIDVDNLTVGIHIHDRFGRLGLSAPTANVSATPCTSARAAFTSSTTISATTWVLVNTPSVPLYISAAAI